MASNVESGEVQIRPVTDETRDAFRELFAAKGCPGFCWCTPYRFKDAQDMSRKEKREAMFGLIKEGTPVGVLAFDGDEPVGWCSVAPRSTYVKLQRSRTMPAVDEDAWTILCVFVRPSHREQGVAHILVAGAIRYAKDQGARVVEAYPWDTAGLSGVGPARHWGHSKVYASVGFEREGKTRRWTRTL